MMKLKEVVMKDSIFNFILLTISIFILTLTFIFSIEAIPF